jgi:hypothetical protein
MCLLGVAARPSVVAAVVTRPVASVRSRPDPRSELLTQEVYGRPIAVEAVRGDWAKCLCRDGTRGWLPRNYFCAAAGFRPLHVVSKRFAFLDRASGTPLELPMGALVEAGGRRRGRVAVLLPAGETGWMGADALVGLKARALGGSGFARVLGEVIGAPYLWGGTSTFGFDCSGLVRFIFDIFGVDLPRNSSDQALRGRRVGASSPLRPFDLVFFGERGGRVDHVAIHIGDLGILHASGDVRIESLDPASAAFRADLAGRIRGVRRIVRR